MFSQQQTIPGDPLFPRTSEWFVTTVNHHGFRICYTLSDCLDVTPYLRPQDVHVSPTGLYLLAHPSPTAFNLRQKGVQNAHWFSGAKFSFIYASSSFLQAAHNKVAPPSCVCNDTMFMLIKAVWDPVCQNMCQHVKDSHSTPCTVNTKPARRVA